MRGVLYALLAAAVFMCGVRGVRASEAKEGALRGVIGAALPSVGQYAEETGNTGARPSGKKMPLVCIDPGHQRHSMQDAEPNGPGSSVMKQKLTSGTDGVVSGKAEYEVNLEISLLLKAELEKRGYEVLMTRESDDVTLSNAERAAMANKAGADVFLRIHCNSSADSSVHGVLCYKPGKANPYLSQEVIRQSETLAGLLLLHQTAMTGQAKIGLLDGDDMTGINWAEMPVVIVETGYMSNPDEDLFLADRKGQSLIAEGLANGVDAYFAS